MTIMSQERQAIEDFIIYEADLLDSYMLKDWLKLLTPQFIYLVSHAGTSSALNSLHFPLIEDDFLKISERVRQLLGKFAWAENPKSRTRRLISNFKHFQNENGEVIVHANFMVNRVRQDRQDLFVGQYKYKLVKLEAGYMLAGKTVTLDCESLHSQSRIGFIL